MDHNLKESKGLKEINTNHLVVIEPTLQLIYYTAACRFFKEKDDQIMFVRRFQAIDAQGLREMSKG